MKRICLVLILAALTLTAHAEDSYGFSISREWADVGDITSVNFISRHVDDSSHFGIQFTNSLSAASITERDGFKENYLAWEGSLRVGYFSDVSIYLEGGLDLGELIVEGIFGGDDDSYYDDDDDVDSFIGVGVGLVSDNISINLYSRYRHINGLFLDDTNDVFSGIEFNFHF